MRIRVSHFLFFSFLLWIFEYQGRGLFKIRLVLIDGDYNDTFHLMSQFIIYHISRYFFRLYVILLNKKREISIMLFYVFVLHYISGR